MSTKTGGKLKLYAVAALLAGAGLAYFQWNDPGDGIVTIRLVAGSEPRDLHKMVSWTVNGKPSISVGVKVSAWRKEISVPRGSKVILTVKVNDDDNRPNQKFCRIEDPPEVQAPGPDAYKRTANAAWAVCTAVIP